MPFVFRSVFRGFATHRSAIRGVRSSAKDLGLPSGIGDGSHFKPCPLSGLRALELATGGVPQYLEELSHSYLEELAECFLDLSPQDVDQVLSDFHLGKARVAVYLKQKLQCWDLMPWKFAALADPDEVKARALAVSLLASFDGAEQNPALHHRITWHCLRENIAMRQAFSAFASGEPMSSLPILQRFSLHNSKGLVFNRPPQMIEEHSEHYRFNLMLCLVVVFVVLVLVC